MMKMLSRNLCHCSETTLIDLFGGMGGGPDDSMGDWDVVALQEAFAEESDVTVCRTYGSKHQVFKGIGGRARKPSLLIGLRARWANYVVDCCSVLGAVAVRLKCW